MSTLFYQFILPLQSKFQSKFLQILGLEYSKNTHFFEQEAL